MAIVDWKGAQWEAAHTSLSIPEILTVLKGFGPMEVLRFINPGYFKGEMSLCITDDGTREVTLYNLEVVPPRRQGMGRSALKWLRKIFKGPVFLEFPDLPAYGLSVHPSLPFWFRMYREGLIDALDCENFYLDPGANDAELDRLEEKILSAVQQGADTRTACVHAKK